MSFDSLVRELRTYPRAIAVVAAVSVLVGLLWVVRISPGGIETRRYEVGYARAAAVVDTRPSQVIDSTAGGSSIAELTNRAKLLADLMTRSPLREEIADRAGIPRSQLLTQRPMNGLEKRLTLPEVTQARVGEHDRDASILHAGVNFLVEGESPIIGVDVRAPDPESAARLADAAIATLKDYLERSSAASQLHPTVPLEVHELEPATGEPAAVGPPPAMALFAVALVFALGCGATLAATRLRGALRRRRFAV
jgi:hypothetical protein